MKNVLELLKKCRWLDGFGCVPYIKIFSDESGRVCEGLSNKDVLNFFNIKDLENRLELMINKAEAKEMTVQQISDALGFDVKVVK